MYNINTNTYDYFFTNKKSEIIEMYKDFENHILSKDKKIIRNFLKKTITFKLENRVAEVSVNSDKLKILFMKCTKEYDKKNKLTSKKGYTHSNFCMNLDVKNKSDLEYAMYLFDKEYEYITSGELNDKIELLRKKLQINIRNIDKKIKMVKVQKGIIYKGNRNFIIIETRGYGLNVRIQNVKDNDNILKIVGRSEYEPLCRSFRILNEEDIKTIMPLIIKSYEMTKYPAKDIKDGIVSF